MERTIEHRVEQMIRGGFNITSIAMAVGWTETEVIHFRAKMTVPKPTVDKRTKEQILSQIRAITKLRLEDGAKLRKDVLIELAEALCRKR